MRGCRTCPVQEAETIHMSSSKKNWYYCTFGGKSVHVSIRTRITNCVINSSKKFLVLVKVGIFKKVLTTMQTKVHKKDLEQTHDQVCKNRVEMTEI